MNSKNKLVIVINGTGGVGKTTLVEIAATQMPIMNVSSITPAKKIAMQAGWDGEMNARGRAFLVDLHQALIRYDDLPYKYLLGRYREFTLGDDDIMFVHMREPDQIERFKLGIQRRGGICKTILIKRGAGRSWGNKADDNVAEYKYDEEFDNNASLKESGDAFVKKLRIMFKDVESLPNLYPL